MPLTFLIDEHLRGAFARALIAEGLRQGVMLDVLQIGDIEAPARGASDIDILLWTEQRGRILISFDVNSLPMHLQSHLASGRHSPGIFLVRPAAPWSEVLSFIVLASVAGTAEEFKDQWSHIPP